MRGRLISIVSPEFLRALAALFESFYQFDLLAAIFPLKPFYKFRFHNIYVSKFTRQLLQVLARRRFNDGMVNAS